MLRRFRIDYKKSRMPKEQGWRLDLMAADFTSILINVYDTGTVTVQGGKPKQAELIEHLKHALALYENKVKRKRAERSV